VILDKSGSMASKTNDVIEGFNAYIAGLGKEDQVNYLFSLTLFDTQLAYRHVAARLPEVKRLDSKSYRPGGNTALNDAIGITVRKVEADQPKVDKVVTVIMTDGEENSSREWTHDAVRGLIEQKENEGRWTFVFLGAGLDAWHQGRSYGVQAANVAQYRADQYPGCLRGHGCQYQCVLVESQASVGKLLCLPVERIHAQSGVAAAEKLMISWNYVLGVGSVCKARTPVADNRGFS
jgi:hypothetical protein